MITTEKNQWTLSNYLQHDSLEIWIDAFLVSRQSQNLSKGTVEFYKWKLGDFGNFCSSQSIANITQISPAIIREYLLLLENQGHNPGGIHGFYRSVKCFLKWWELEVEPQGWTNPIRKVKPPKVPEEILEPVSLEVVQKMMSVCSTNMNGRRDLAILYFLMDSGVRASELLSINLQDTNPLLGDVLVRRGKGGKVRSVYLGRKSRKALRQYLRMRTDNNDALWITNQGERLSYRGLKMIMRRRAEKANCKVPEIHAFRRFFAKSCLNNGMDIFSLQKLMGHSDISILRRYLKQTNGDIKLAFYKSSPVDNL
jgi:integrase/recombinase XerD